MSELFYNRQLGCIMKPDDIQPTQRMVIPIPLANFRALLQACPECTSISGLTDEDIKALLNISSPVFFRRPAAAEFQSQFLDQFRRENGDLYVSVDIHIPGVIAKRLFLFAPEEQLRLVGIPCLV